MKNDPCFSCSLPECDDRDPRCKVRVLANSYSYKMKRAPNSVTDVEREAATRQFHYWNLDRQAEASEGGKPYRRGKKLYGSGASS